MAMLKQFAIYSVQSFEVKTPLGARQVKIYTKTGSISQEIPDEIAPQIDSIAELNSERVIEGIGQVLVQTPRGIFPQAVNFTFDESVMNEKQAFERFDEYLQKTIEEMQAEQNKRQIQTASPAALAAIDKVAQSQGGILMP